MSTNQTFTINYDIILDAGEHMNWVLISESGNEFILEGTNKITVPTEETFALERKAVIPIAYTLHQNYPNPFNPITQIEYDLPRESHVHLVIFDILGREVITLFNEIQKPGYKSTVWQGLDNNSQQVGAGVYFYQIQAQDFTETKKMVLLK